jgi:simple sugar transport system ATP-binding protein/ribose transport system ATP-binding protein
MTAFLAARGITKRFGGVRALSDVSLEIDEGTIHALVGENGAGKSTFGKVLAGMHSPDGGVIVLDGKETRFRSTRDALMEARITIVGQERAVIPQRTVLENVFLGRDPNWHGILQPRGLVARYDELCAATGIKLPPRRKVSTLRVSDQLQVEILRALVRDARLIIMDEVTAALTVQESERVFELVRSLRQEGRAILYISHFLKEVLMLSDTVTILRDGHVVRSAPARDETPTTLVSGMIGRSLELTFPQKAYPPADAPVVLSVRGLSRPGVIDDISFDVRAGEIVGLAGLIGSGRSEVARAIFGADRTSEGIVSVGGEVVTLRRPRDGVNAGIALLPESRKEEGLLMRRSIVENVSLTYLEDVSSHGLVQPRRERRAAGSLIGRLDVRTSSPTALVDTLSGGNQQKVLFAKWLFRRPRVLIADEPTRGVDVGAKQAIYGLITELAAQGVAILLISSELEEVLGLAHRVLVMRLGSIVAEFDGESATDDAVMRAAFATETAA